ncbi:AraC family transcriptional regulator N-terminal domain-containing protein [Thalassolituus sp. LLYu03]|uniref:AraC family transcriptional regulator n=1 Tax=Thalassolituus sp. LLYu03 TaxID=3421656 RepID=UPI003D2CF3EF
MSHPHLATIIEQATTGNEDRRTAIEPLVFFRREEQAPPCICMIEPSIVLVAQGAKRMWIGDEGFLYDPERFLITSLDLPANSEVVEASRESPCVGLALKLDMQMLAELIALGSLPPPPVRADQHSVGLGTLTPDLLQPLERLLALLNEPDSIPVLAPLILREIHYRLLQSDQAARLWQIVAAGSQSQRVAKAIDWLKQNYSKPLRIDELAGRVQMSTSTLHHHFRKLTSMSPLQYQKWLRLNEAKRLMLNSALDATSAAFQVGYESPSQFSREYSRLFGLPPKRDIEGLRSQVR